MVHELELLGVRKSMVSCEIREIDNKIANLYGMRRIVLERLAGFEQDESSLEHDGRCLNPCDRCILSLNDEYAPLIAFHSLVTLI